MACRLLTASEIMVQKFYHCLYFNKSTLLQNYLIFQRKPFNGKKVSFHTNKSNFVPIKSVTLAFIDRHGVKVKVDADVGDTLLDVAKDNDIDGVEGACGGTLACSTCHCIFKQKDFERLGLQKISEEELDMLDLAYGLTDTSRLVCSIEVNEEMEGIEITVPSASNDART